jgi:lipoprotein-anchoring transpeptidase ErfK/SrfK
VAGALVTAACGGLEAPADDAQAPPAEPAVETAASASTAEAAETAENAWTAEAAETAGGAEPEEPERDRTLVATSVVDEVQAYRSPHDDAEVTHIFQHPNERGVPRVFLVEERRDDGWLEVLLPVRPAGSKGWIREVDVELAANPYRIDVDLIDLRLTIHREGELVIDAPIGYGDGDTPAAGGRYYLTELLRPPSPDGPYGPYAFGLSGYSDLHLSFAGGEGVIGIHGTDEHDSIGVTVHTGSIRVHNDVIIEMATFLPLGTPVTIG